MTSPLEPTVVLSEEQLRRPNPLRRRNADPAHIASFDTFRDLQLADELKIQLNYTVTKLLGRGGQGVVVALERQSHQACITHHALKIFDPSVYPTLVEYNRDLERIARQVGVLQRLSHPNLVNCNWMYESDGVGMMLMEHIDGLSLDQVLDQGEHRKLRQSVANEYWQYVNDVIFNNGRSIQAGIALYILRKMLRGIDVLHRVGYIHCDIKPNNIMLDLFGTVKLIDFGRAIPVDNPENVLVGSYLYMAPEVQERKRLIPQSDLYSAGMVVLELLHGKRLVADDSTENDILQFKLSLPETIETYVAPELRDNRTLMKILRRLLAVTPEERYSSASEADFGDDGVRVVHRQLLRASLDSDYGRDLETYMQARIRLR